MFNLPQLPSPGSAVTRQAWSYSTVILEIWHDHKAASSFYTQEYPVLHPVYNHTRSIQY